MASITVRVDGTEVMIRNAYLTIQKAIKSDDPIRVEGKRIIIELSPRDADAASAIVRRLRERLEDLPVDIEVDD